MSIPTRGVRLGAPVSPARHGQQLSRETDTAGSDATLPLMKNSTDSAADSEIKKVWAQFSSPNADSEWDDAGSGELSEEVAAPVESFTAAPRAAATAAPGITLTTSPTLTTTTTTATAGPQFWQQESESVSEQSTMRLDLSVTDPVRAERKIFNFLAHPSAQTLAIPLQTPDALRKLEHFLYSFRQSYALTMPPEKKIIIDVQQPNTDPTAFNQALNEIGRSRIIGGINLTGDEVLKTWVGLKALLGKNTAIDTLQISGATSDAICQCFKNWTEFHYTPSANAAPGLMVKTLAFSDVRISDAAVFGAMLRTIGGSMRYLQAVDFSATPLSAQQKNELLAQLEPVGMDTMLQF